MVAAGLGVENRLTCASTLTGPQVADVARQGTAGDGGVTDTNQRRSTAMKTDDELRTIADRIVHLHLLPPDQAAKKFLDECGDPTGADLKRMGQVCQDKAEAMTFLSRLNDDDETE
jgi:hypothetical protein